MPDLSYIQPIKKNANIPELFPGDTVKVNQTIKEGDRTRVQVFQGVVVARGGDGPAKNFTVRRIAHGIGVEKSFLLYSPLLESVEVVRRGAVRRAKLTYLRGLSARDARIKEKSRPLAEMAGAAEPEAAPAAEAAPAPEAAAPAAPVAEAPAPPADKK